MLNKNCFFHYSLQAEDFSLAKQYDLLQSKCKHSGAIVNFSGLVRDMAKSADQIVECIELSVYQSMAEKQIQHIGEIVFNSFDIDGLNIVHRYGKLKPTENIVYVGVASKHRSEAFSAAQMTMDHLKAEVTFWKKEHYKNDSESKWIEPRKSDHQALNKWHKTVK